ncbi:MAG: hypothetical protein IT285_05175 [Bdellovibrionales bacterium]|nr:hypothetical protein [Bdellovibrionales bacterium]
MALRDRYDWVVLGDHPGALLSGCLAAQLGYSVLLLPLAPWRGAFMTRSGQILDPETNFILGLGRTERSHALLAECLFRMGGLPESGGVLRMGAEVAPQVLTPLSRLTLACEDDRLLSELEREWGKEAARASAWIPALAAAEPAVASWWRGFPERLTQNPRQGMLKGGSDGARLLGALKDALATAGGAGEAKAWFAAGAEVAAIERRSARPESRELAAGAWFALLGAETESVGLSEFAHAQCLGRTAASFRGGLTAYRRHLIGIAGRLGAYVVDDAECRRIFVENERVMGVQMSHRGKMIGVGSAVLGCSLDHAREFVSFSGKNRESLLKAAPAPNGWRFTLALTVNREAVPPGMGARLVWQERGAPALEVEVAEPVSYVPGSPEGRLIFARTVLPFTQESLEPARLRVLAARMFRQLSEILPFVEHHVTHLYPDFRDPVSPQGASDPFAEAYGFVSPAMIPDPLRSLPGPGIGCESGISGLYVCSSESFPAFGSFGSTVAALEAVSRFALQAGGPAERPFERLWDFLK